MIVTEYIYGQITVHFSCGCEADIGWTHRDSSITGIDTQVELEEFSSCNSHSHICPQLFNWKDIFDSVFEEIQEEKGVKNYRELFNNHDRISTKHELNYYLTSENLRTLEVELV